MTSQRLPAILSALIALAIYSITLGGTYIYDDLAIVREDPRVQESTRWHELWTHDYNNGGVDNLYRPIVSMSYWLQWRIHGDRPWLFHLVNVLLHAAVSAAVAEFARKLLGLRAAYITGILFAVHPIHVEAVAGIVGRAESLCALGMIGAMILFMHRPMTIQRAIAICACLILALLSKEQGMLLPFLLLLLDRLRDWKKRGRSSFLSASPDAIAQSAPPSLEYAPHDLHDPIRAEKFSRQILTLLLCFTLSGYIYLRENILHLKFYWDRSFLDWTIQPMIRSTGSDRWLMPLALLGRYTSLLIAPLRLSIDYGGSAIGWTVRHDDPYLFLGVIAVFLWLLLSGIALIKRQGPLLFSLLALAMTYGVVGNIVSIIGTNFGERLMYLPSFFFILVLAVFFQRSALSVQRCLFLVITILFAARTMTYAAKWNDRLAFYQYSLANQPRSVRIYMLLADENMKRRNFPEAERVDALGRALEPNYWDIYVQSAVVAEKLGKLHEADDFLHRAMVIRPSMSIVARRSELHRKHPELNNATDPAPRMIP